LKLPSDAEVVAPNSPPDYGRAGANRILPNPAEWQPPDFQECRGQKGYGSSSRLEILHPNVLKSIMRDAELSFEDLERLLR
jgi:hypothetical protein